MKARNPSTGNLEEVYVKALDSLPVGTIVDYDGQASDIPTGWVTYGTGQIKKTSETRALSASVLNASNNSTTSTYSCDYINSALEWKPLATGVTYNTATNLPNNFSELAVYVKLSTYDEIFSVNVVKPYINTTTRKQITFGGEGYLVYVNITNTQITEVGIIKNGTTQTSVTYDVYYR